MDLGTLVGIPLGLTLLVTAILYGGASLMIYIDVPSILITIGGSFASLLVTQDLANLKQIGKFFGIVYKQPKSNIPEIIKQLVSFSEKSRREGLLYLEDEVEQISDEFFKQGIRLVVDGTDPEVIKTILYNQLNQMNARHSSAIAIFDSWGKLAPAWGMIGTLYGLVAMLANLGDPSQICKGMSAALITTFYGAILANLIFVPVKDKLSMRDANETAEKEIILEGILSIQSGDNPRVVEEKLLAFVAPGDRLKLKQTSDS